MVNSVHKELSSSQRIRHWCHRGRATQQFTVSVRGANTAPIFTSTPILSTAVGSIYRYDATAVDTEDEVLYSLVNRS